MASQQLKATKSPTNFDILESTFYFTPVISSRNRARPLPRFSALVVLESATTIYGEGSFGALCLLSPPSFDGRRERSMLRALV
jgi:hypothetical protein